VIGIDGAEAMIDAFQLDLGKISTKDLKGDDLEKAIEAIFSKAADDMAGAVAPGSPSSRRSAKACSRR
jgi:hypothetical protein